MITRKIGKLFRGEATPFQLILACVLGAIIGFLPGFGAAPGLFVFFLLALIVLNANLFLAGLVMLGSKLLSYLLLPLSFSIGRFFIDGPFEGMMTWAINAPVLAWFGFETYVATGGLVLGLAVGLIVGFVMVSLVQGFRRKLSGMREGSEAYKKWMSKPMVKIPVWIFFGSGSKKDLETIRSKKLGLVVRPLGVVLVVLVAVVIVVASLFLQETILTTTARSALERVNGASVDLDRVHLDLPNGELTIEGLALVDPEDLMRNTFSASRLTADLSGLSLLRKKAVIDRLEIVDGNFGGERRFPGSHVGPRPKPPKPVAEDVEGRTIDDYLKSAQLWRDRLGQARRWMDRFAGGDDEGDSDTPDAGVPLAERLRQQAEALGYASVKADHRIVSEPTLTIRLLSAEGVRVQALPAERLRIAGRNLSTQPGLLSEGPEIEVVADSGTMKFLFEAGSMGTGTGENRIDAFYRGYPVDTLKAALRDAKAFPLSGGEMDVALKGNFNTADLNLPLNVTVKNTELVIPGGSSSRVSELLVPVEVRGPLDNPRIVLGGDALKQALVAAGREELTRQLSGQAEALIGDRIPSSLLPGSGSKSTNNDDSEEKSEPSVQDAVRGLFR